MRKSILIIASLAVVLLAGACKEKENGPKQVVIATLDPGHFHAALVQKTSYPQVSQDVYVYSNPGADLQEHLAKIEAYNTRAENPTSWNEIVYTGPDFLEKMISDGKANVMVTAGNNLKKTEYIKKTLEAGINVLADKPMAINPENFQMLKECFQIANSKNVLLYDIMTERHEITTILQRELSLIADIYGQQEKGTPENPGITMESVHHFYKEVSGKPNIRPAWFYDVEQQGEGIVDVATHLVDLVQWQCYPDQILSPSDVKINSARHWPTLLSLDQFKASTGLDAYPDFLMKDVKDGVLEVYQNGEINWQLKGLNASITVLWNYQAPEGGGDTHYCEMRGTKANITIRQTAEQNWKPELYIEANNPAAGYEDVLNARFAELEKNYPGIKLEKMAEGVWHVFVPDSYRNGHEAHFGQVTENFLQYFADGKLPDWEQPNMITKYYTTTEAYKIANGQ
ncbi:MAG: Gfo/Idh/MocA family oxidoreductase [Bacteroidales bacterium]|nr:Gfo/Idh/MocA family oxidoreductase [Bacteroidales bacterium]